MFNGISMEFIEYLNEDVKKKKRTLSVFRATIIATGSHLLYIKYEFYGFNNDLRDRITLQKSLP